MENRYLFRRLKRLIVKDVIIKQTLKLMKKHCLLFLLFCFCCSIGQPIAVAAQEVVQKNIRLELKNERLPEVFKRLEKISGYKIMFTYDDVNHLGVTGTVESSEIKEVMDYIISNKPLDYRIDGMYIYVTLRENEKKRLDAESKFIQVEGRVFDKNKIPLIGVNVLVIGTNNGVITDEAGNFSLKVLKGNVSDLQFTFIGMKPVIKSITGDKNVVGLSIIMEEDQTSLDEIVVNGIFERKKESFTGSATVIRKEELGKSGNQNLLQSLRNIDPSFKIVENMDFGSNPNQMPEIQMRGQQSMPDLKGTYNGNPNQPLFILDGFETDITTVYDLDMNRVETIVLLKDAAAKAIYGAKAANGVVVIETRKPESGKLRITYKGDLNLTLPDLTGYNLCNAQEKYEVDKAHGLYSDPWFWEQYLNGIKYEVERGVDTDWLSQPLRTGVGHRHSLYMEGGDNHFRYGVDLLYNDLKGVMKGSDRETFSGGFTLSYRYKNLLFRNQFSASLNRADDSPYGSFSEYTQLNPYWTPYDEDGNLKQIAGSTGGGGLIGVTCGNPLWNASIGTKNFSKYTDLTNNFYIEWQTLENLKLIARLGLSKRINGREDFYPASHTKFLGYSEERFFEKGSYSQMEGENSSVNIDLTANYSLLINKHQLFLNAGYSMEEDRAKNVTFTVVGFPNERQGFITSGLGHSENYPPTGSESISRELGLLSALNYSYDDRYLADLSFRMNASSRFGKDERWGSFWSAGIGWNLHKEHFMEDVAWLKQFKLRASTGYTGSQNFNPYQALAMFGYYQTQAYDNWAGSYLMALPNDHLKWQKTQDYNIGFDMNLWGRFILRYDYYVQETKDQLLALTIPPSMGFTSYMENLGSTQNKGMEIKLNTHLVYDPSHDRYLSAFFSIAKNTNKLKKISNSLRAYNDEVDKNIMEGNSNRPQTRFIEGQSMNAIWAVRSLGIDPATGDEIFLTKDGKTTTEWRTEDQVVCGDAMPDCTGTFGLNLDWKGIFFNMSCYYQFGGQTYNQTLVDRVENANVSLNVDKRIYDSVWKQPGDRVNFSYSPYKTTKPSSRFVQDLNELRLSSLNIGYDFRRSSLLDKIGLEQLKVSFYMNDVFRLSTVKVERGLSYPFARTYSLSLQATF